MIKLFLVILVFVAAAVFVGLGFNVLLRRKPFPETHVGHNKNMKKFGITCVKTFDAMEQKKAWQEERFAKMKIDIQSINTSKND